ncbi:MAG TPA: hypothetical protein VFA99_00885 [Acidobacteriaceae bacterium]|nr:hypothetical protein [Acidobacteriaceae bacterium]
MRTSALDSEFGSAIEVHSFSVEDRKLLLPRLWKMFAATGCSAAVCRRCGRRTVEYRFDVELGAVLELYCGLAQTGLEMTEVSHRALTELCMLRTHERALRAGVRVVSVRLRISFLQMPESPEIVLMQAASA